MDSNHRRHKPADLQSAPFGHFGTSPTAGSWSGRWESNPPHQLGRLAHYHYATPALRATSTERYRSGFPSSREKQLIRSSGAMCQFGPRPVENTPSEDSLRILTFSKILSCIELCRRCSLTVLGEVYCRNVEGRRGCVRESFNVTPKNESPAGGGCETGKSIQWPA